MLFFLLRGGYKVVLAAQSNLVSANEPNPGGETSESELRRSGEQIRRQLVRANTAAIIILVIVIALALAAVAQSWRAGRHAAEAEAANVRAQEELYRSRLAQARAGRVGGAAGRRTESLAALGAAARQRPSLELRNEAIACLALFDIARGDFEKSFRMEVPFAAFDPSFRYYATGDRFGEIEICRVQDQGLEHRLTGPRAVVNYLAFSPDGRFLVARHEGRRQIIWDVQQEVAISKSSMAPGDPFDMISFAPDNSWVATGERMPGNYRIHLYRLPAGNEDAPLDFSFQPGQFAAHPDSVRIAIATNQMILLWDRIQGRALGALQHSNAVMRLAWHPDGHRLVSLTRDGFLHFWDIGRERPLREFPAGHAGPVRQLFFNHRGDLLVSASEEGVARFWDVPSGRMLFQTRQAQPIAFDPDDRRLAYRKGRAGLGWWTIQPSSTYRGLFLSAHRGAGTSVEVSPDGNSVVACANFQLFGWDLRNPAPPEMLGVAPADSAAFSGDGQSLFTTGPEGMQCWTVKGKRDSGGLVLEPSGSFLSGEMLHLGPATITHGLHEWVAASGPAGVIIHDLAKSGRPVPLEWVPRALSAAVSADSRWLVTSGPNQSTALYDLPQKRQMGFLHPRGGTVNFSPDGERLIMGCSDEYACWEVGKWTAPSYRIAREAPGQQPGFSSFSRDGKLMAINPSLDTLKLVEPTTGRELAAFASPYPQTIESLSLSYDGTILAAGTDAGEIQVWNLMETRRGLAQLGLDWESGAAGAVTSAAIVSPQPQSGLPWLPLAGTLIALAFGVYVLRYQLRLVRSYGDIKQLVAQRNRELARTQAELMHSEKMKALGTLAAGIAHDFNNLLSVIRLAADFLRRGVKDKPDLVEETDAIEQAVQQGKQVVHSMLGYSRSKSDEPELLHVAEVVEDTLGLLSQQFLSGTNLTVSLDRDAPRVRLPRSRLEQILLNLIVNASEAMQGGGRLAITVRTLPARPASSLILAPREAPQYVELTVADSGPGIPPETLPRIFEPFFTTKVAGTTHGTGLGLSTVYTAAQKDGLGISVETESGKGTTFRIFLPAERTAT